MNEKLVDCACGGSAELMVGDTGNIWIECFGLCGSATQDCKDEATAVRAWNAMQAIAKGDSHEQ